MIYIVCPANYASGGPELLHQLGYKLNLFGIEASILYYNRVVGRDPVCQQYRRYNVPYVDDLSIGLGDTVVITEGIIPIIHRLKACRRVIWWLSVDGAQYTDSDLDYMRVHKDIMHLAQSQYALDFLKGLGIEENVFFLSDYINSDFLASALGGEPGCCRSDVVLFNPQKCTQKTLQLIIGSDYRIHWQALYGLTPDGMREVMRKAKVYIDFGYHPGKDRIPREAALCGCCVVTNRNGSARNSIDVPIPECYKFDENSTADQILECVYGLLEHYEERKQDYLPYVQKIFDEFMEFEKDIIRFFGIIMNGEDVLFDSPEQYIEDIVQHIEDGSYGAALRLLIYYRIHGYEESVVVDILETVIRIGIYEYQEAEICAFRGLKKDPNNYELYLNLAHISFLTDKYEVCREYCEKAKLFSRGTLDEQYIENVCETEFNLT